MMSSICRSQRGFTLIEIMVVLLVTAVALLALGSFSLSVMDSGTQSRERLTAVHLAEQVIEEWQHDANDYYPAIASDCTMSAGSAALTIGTTKTYTCTPVAGTQNLFTIAADVSAANAPLPDGLGNIASTAMSGTVTYINTPTVKLVTVSWPHKGATKSIYLTHLTR